MKRINATKAFASDEPCWPAGTPDIVTLLRVDSGESGERPL